MDADKSFVFNLRLSVFLCGSYLFRSLSGHDRSKGSTTEVWLIDGVWARRAQRRLTPAALSDACDLRFYRSLRF
jgi:hypothetical protein